ncbi:MAG: hypothetical protein J5I93_11455 [Pirellulaceae bacterium]|nr:hypothetical protein [Pirellulaceae bacterium]
MSRFSLASMLLVGMLSSAEARAQSEPFRLMSEARDAEYRTYLPEVDDSHVAEMLADPRLILYTEREMPQAYQDWSSGLPGIHSPTYNISANRSEPFGNGNREFPWSDPAGTHRSDGVRSFRFLHLPVDDQDRQLPVVWFRKSLRYASQQGYAWRFPVGTVFGEVLQLRSPSGQWLTFEMRIRQRELDDWAVNVFRPYPTAERLVAAIKELRPNWSEQPSLAALVSHLESPAELPVKILKDNHPKVSFKQKMGVDTLPPVGDDQLVGDLLTKTTFQSALSVAWRGDKRGVWTNAPTTSASFHIVPAKYDAGFIDVERNSCLRCHETVNHNVQEFQPARDWYGRIRGSDGIFSFHPFATSSISYNGISQGVSLRRELIDAGLLEKFDPQQHPTSVYNSISKLVE